MNRQKIDIHNSAKKYAIAKERWKNDNSLSKRNRELILTFLGEAELGKTVLHKQKKKIGNRACLKYGNNLKTCAQFLKKDFDKVNRNDMENFIDRLEKDGIQKKNGESYSLQTKRDFKIVLRKFYKHLLGNNETYPNIVSWMDISMCPEYYTTVRAADVQKMVQAAQSPLDKAVISVLFDLGVRIEEFLNITVNDVIKTKDACKIQINFSKTFTRTIPLDASIPYLEEWLKIHSKTDARLFPLSYHQGLRRLKQVSKKVIGTQINNQIIRHSKATQLAQAGIGHYQMCQWMGWSMSSKMPERYIRREGIDNEKTLAQIKQKRD